MGGPSRAIEGGRPDDASRGLATPNRREPGDPGLGGGDRPLPPRQHVEPRASLVDDIVASAEALVADQTTLRATVDEYNRALRAIGIRGGPRLNADLLVSLARVLAQRRYAVFILRQLAALSESLPDLDVALVVAIAIRESHLSRGYLLGGSTVPLDTYDLGGLDNLGAALGRGARELIPPGYSEGETRWEAARSRDAFEGHSRVDAALVPSDELFVAYGVYIEHIRRRYVEPAVGRAGTLERYDERFFGQLAFGGVAGLSYTDWARATAEYERRRRRHELEPLEREPAFGLNTVVTWLRARARGRTLREVMGNETDRAAMHSTFGGRHRYRRAYVTPLEVALIRRWGLVPTRRFRRSEVR